MKKERKRREIFFPRKKRNFISQEQSGWLERNVFR